MVTVFDDSDINIDDVAFLQHLLLGRDAVTDYVVDRCADRLGEALVVQGRGNCLLCVDDIVVRNTIQLFRGDAGFDMFVEHFQNFGSQATGHAHLFNLFGGLDSYLHRASC